MNQLCKGLLLEDLHQLVNHQDQSPIIHWLKSDEGTSDSRILPFLLFTRNWTSGSGKSLVAYVWNTTRKSTFNAGFLADRLVIFSEALRTHLASAQESPAMPSA